MILDHIPLTISEIKTQYCIVGSGAAGITLALELEKKGFEVVILEAGNFEQKSKVGDEIVIETGLASEVDKRRFKDFGGSTEAWGGWCSLLDESDFQAGQVTDYPGWPLKLADLKPYYARTREILNLGSDISDTKKFAMESVARLSGVTFKHYQFSDPVARFGQKYRDHIIKSTKITTYLNAPVIGMQMNDSSSIVELIKIKTADRVFNVKARHFIFCCGSIENARLMMSFSKKNKHPVGLGYNNLGKGFMEHPNFSNVGTMMLYKKDPWSKLAGVNAPGKKEHFFFQIDEAVRKKNGWLNLRLKISQIENGPNPVDQNIYQFYSETLKRNFHPLLEIGLSGEQMCLDKNGITLRDDVDQFGLSNVNLNWELSEVDWKSYIESVEFFARKLPGLGLGLMKVNKEFLERKVLPAGNSHQMGMTKMAESFKDGYVDKNLSVFGVNNLSILGSSVFPTGGVAAPTMTITALSLKLADYLNVKK